MNFDSFDQEEPNSMKSMRLGISRVKGIQITIPTKANILCSFVCISRAKAMAKMTTKNLVRFLRSYLLRDLILKLKNRYFSIVKLMGYAFNGKPHIRFTQNNSLKIWNKYIGDTDGRLSKMMEWLRSRLLRQ